MTKLRSAAAPTLPTWSIARTLTVCEPLVRPVYSRGLVQAEWPIVEAALKPSAGLAGERDAGGGAAHGHVTDRRAGADVSTPYPRVTLRDDGVTLLSVVVSVARYWR